MKKRDLARRDFLQTATLGAAALSPPIVGVTSRVWPSAGSDKPALLGGEPLRKGRFPSWPQIDDKDERIWREVLHEGAWCELDGNQVTAFEEEFQAAMGEGYVVATANGTSSLHASLWVLDVGPGDEVLMPASTFVASMQAILNLYALPIFVDIDPATGQIDTRKLEAAVSPHTRAIMPVHLGGAAADMDGVMEVARKHSLKVVEDACQSPLAEWRGRKLGLIGDCGCISFQVSKIIPGGEGGAVVTTSERIRTLVHAFRNNGRDPDRRVGNYPYFGMNYRMTEFQGALLRAQLAKFEVQSAVRRPNAAHLDRGLGEIEGLTPLAAYPGNTRRNYYYYAVRYEAEKFGGLPIDRFVQAMRAEGIPVSGSPRRDVLPDSPSLETLLNSRAFRKVCSEEQIARCLASRECPETRRLAPESLVVSQNVLLGSREDMDLILEAVRKVRRHADELRS
jgi:perosamine synthetase